MHRLLLNNVIDKCERRQSEGDCPSIPPLPNERLEVAVTQLADLVRSLVYLVLTEHPNTATAEQVEKLVANACDMDTKPKQKPANEKSLCRACHFVNDAYVIACQRCGHTWFDVFLVPVTATPESAPVTCITDEQKSAWADGWNAGASAMNSYCVNKTKADTNG